MKTDIKTRADIETLVNHFYEKVKPDLEIGFIFTRIVKIDWAHHIPVIINFLGNNFIGQSNL